ncbi:uncharacterized protein MELLADRAFT_72766 [Melampsora larici-populina 98AG31]|uniref:Uncharacterized protein n=1 Tax=Melampsora larici-populina (strain 98AG31 / pathotype 3-4-7) TaxID=747676 RepID=F4RYM9_MELLP|nr:uncharacterized protein MELLADRAFT_72766 [Melampsora larici-populina 98AG31]EGG02497.1 hypothetical protein MELLADRAFT_72766 [Melampsora larici-populina 98AG31]
MKDEECIDMSNEISEDTTTEHNRTLSGSSLSSSSHLRLSSLSSDKTCVETPELLAGSFLDEQKEILAEQDTLFSSTATTPILCLENIQSNPAPASPSLLSTTSSLESQKSFEPEAFQSFCEEKSKPNFPQIQEGGIASVETFEVQIVATSDIFESLSSVGLCGVGNSSDRKCIVTPKSIYVQRSSFTIVSRAGFVLFFSIILHFSLEMFLFKS